MEHEKNEPCQRGLAEIVQQLADLSAQLRDLANKPLFDRPGSNDVAYCQDEIAAATAVALP